MKQLMIVCTALILLYGGRTQCLEIYSGKLLIAEIPPAHFEQIATSKIKINGQESSAIRLDELIQMCQSSADSIEVRSESESIRFTRKEWNDSGLFLLFTGNGSPDLYSSSISPAHLPRAVEQIILLKKNYFPPGFLLEILLLILMGFFIFYKTRSLLLQCTFLFVATFLIYEPFDLPDMGNVSDNFWYVPTSLSILKEGNLELSEYRNLVNLNRPDYRLIHIGNSVYNSFPIGPSIFTLPFVWIASHVYPETIPEWQRLQEIAALVGKWMASLAVALLFALVYRQTNHTGVSLLLAVCFAFATNHFNTHAGGLWSHNVALPFLIAALWMLTSANEAVVSFSAVPLAMLYITRPTYALPIFLITIYLFFYHRKSFFLYVLTGTSCALVFFLFNHNVYGHFLSPGYEKTTFGISNFAEGLTGHMISPNRGLLIFSPIFILSFFGIYLSRQQPFFRLLSMIALAGWLMLAFQTPPRWGGHCIGPRQFCDLLPIWILLILPAIQLFSSREFAFRIPAWILFFGLSAWSLFVQLRSVTDPAVHQWNDDPVMVENASFRIWDWNDMQIFRTNSSRASQAPEVWCGPTEIAKIPEPYFRRIAGSEVRINERKIRAVDLPDLVKLCGLDVREVRISNQNETLNLSPSEIQNVRIFFIAVRGTTEKELRPYFPENFHASFAGTISKITVEN